MSPETPSTLNPSCCSSPIIAHQPSLGANYTHGQLSLVPTCLHYGLCCRERPINQEVSWLASRMRMRQLLDIGGTVNWHLYTAFSSWDPVRRTSSHCPQTVLAAHTSQHITTHVFISLIAPHLNATGPPAFRSPYNP
jgi:hypothetical protein